MKTLTPRQLAFVDEYVQDGNATQAAVRAGYSKRGAHVQGGRMLKNVYVMNAIEQRQVEASNRADISVDWILDRLKHEAQSAESDGARVRALELLGKSCRMFADNDNNKPIKHEDLLKELDAILEVQESPPLLEHDECG